MSEIRIGSSDLNTARIGLGCMAMSEFYGSWSETENLRTLHRALELGVTLLDTADLYGDGENELLLGKLLRQSTQPRPLIATKCGIVRTNEILSDGNFKRERNGQPQYIKQSCERSLLRLGVDVIDLYYLHRVDPNVPIEDSVGAIADLVGEGKVRAVGLSEVTAEELRRAHSVHPIAAVQSEYSLWTREIEVAVLPAARALGVTVVCYSPIGRGLLRASSGAPPNLDVNDFRRTLPRFSAASFASNAALFDLLEAVATESGMTPAQVCLSWLLTRNTDVIVIPGSRKTTHLEENWAVLNKPLQQKWLSRLSDGFAQDRVAGHRYTQGNARAS
jgi:aryl-alcohol dehydrogenase-like predicted oxidoreductase